MTSERGIGRRAPAILAWLLLLGVTAGAEISLLLPNQPASLKFAVIGDNGTGDRPEYEVAAQMATAHQLFPYELVLMVGDNFYGSQKPDALERKFARPFAPLLAAGVAFRAALGNHDDLDTIDYPPINMQGRRYYTFARGGVRFLVLDTNVLDETQIAWAEDALRQSREAWRVAYFHHPLYGNARRHGANVDLRVMLEPLLVRYGVRVVFSGHDHVYERLTPQRGIQYFVVGSSGQLRRRDLERSESTAAGYDEDRAFLLAEIGGDEMHFQVVSRTGATVDAGRLSRLPVEPRKGGT